MSQVHALKAKTLQEGEEQTNQHRLYDPLKVMNVAEKECDQLGTWLVKYDQKSEQTSG
jgi:hypothetical protein